MTFGGDGSCVVARSLSTAFALLSLMFFVGVVSNGVNIFEETVVLDPCPSLVAVIVLVVLVVVLVVALPDAVVESSPLSPN